MALRSSRFGEKKPMFLEDFRDWLFGPQGRWFGIWVSLLVFTIIIVVIASLLPIHPWGDVTCDRILSYASEQCEFINQKGFLRQQANFWSNFAYLFFGLKIINQHEQWVRKMTGIGFVLLWLGSGLFHGTLTGWGQYLDVIGIYIVLLMLVLHAWVETVHRGTMDQVLAALWSILFMVAAILMGWHKDTFDSTIMSFGSGGLLTLIGVYGAGRQNEDWDDPNRYYRILLIRKLTKWLVPGLIAAAVFGGAAAFKYEDGKEITLPDCKACDYCADVKAAPAETCSGTCSENACCDAVCSSCQEIAQGAKEGTKGEKITPRPFCFGTNPVFQGHALWHLFSAIGLYFVFKFFIALNWET
jgi:hypothetical protein